MIRNRPLKIPYSEHTRWYGRQGDLNCRDIILPCEYESEEERNGCENSIRYE